MAAAVELTWDIAEADGGARKPSLDDMGGAALEDDPDYPPPEDPKYVSAAALNQVEKQVAALARASRAVTLTVAYTAGTPSVVAIEAASATLTAADFTCTDNGTGDVTISWPTARLPPRPVGPIGSPNAGAAGGMFDAVTLSATSIRCRVGSGGVPADVRFTVTI